MLVSFLISCFLLAISPGPDNIYLSALTLKSGKIAGLSFLGGLITGCFFHTILIAFGLNELLIKHEVFFDIIKYSGVSYLLFLSFHTYRSGTLNIFTAYSNKKNNNKKLFKHFKRGVLMNLLNPKVFLFFTLFFPNFIYSKIYSFKFQILTLGVIFISITFIIFVLIILFSDFIKKIFSFSNNFKIFTKYFNILVLLIIAILILFTENNLTLTN